MRNRMIVSLVALVLVAMAFLSTTNQAWAKSTPVVRTSADLQPPGHPGAPGSRQRPGDQGR